MCPIIKRRVRANPYHSKKKKKALLNNCQPQFHSENLSVCNLTAEHTANAYQ